MSAIILPSYLAPVSPSDPVLFLNSIKLVTELGKISGAEIDKIKQFNLKFEKSKFIKSPILEKAYVSFECKLQKNIKCGDHTLMIGKIVNVRYRKNSFNKKGSLKVSHTQPLLYIGNHEYVTTTHKKIK